MAKKGGGKSDLGPLYQYSDKALALGKQQYDENVRQMQPWYSAGEGAINQLKNLMGLKSQQVTPTRQSMLDQYRPQFTTQQKAVGAGFKPVSPTGGDSAGNEGYRTWLAQTGNQENKNNRGRLATAYNNALNAGWRGGVPQGESVDTAALNSFIDQKLSAQGDATQSDGTFGKLTQNYTGQDLYTDPSYKFRFDQGTKSAERQLARSGQYLTPQATQALSDYGQQMASQEFGNAYNRFNTDQNNLFSRLATLSGYGQNAAGANAQAGQEYANNATNIYSGLGSSVVGQQQANATNRTSMFNSLLNLGGGLIGKGIFSDIRLKDNIQYIGVENGHNIYEFTYRNNPDKKFIGVIAQEVQSTHPEAVIHEGHFLSVDYGAIGVDFRESV